MNIDPADIKALFLELKELSADRRAAILTERCHHQPELQREVESLLKNHDSMNTIDPDAIGLGLLGLQPELNTSLPQMPDQIGPFKLLGILGYGGMGVVYEAQQDQPNRHVALKIIRSGVVSAETIRRFKRESSALARLKHPGIAQIYETNTIDSDDGTGTRPYFVMELVDGQPITEYVNRTNLSIRDRLSLVAQVNDAIEHAHQRGVIHRDLKPNNILVTDSGQIKVLDFGIARIDDKNNAMTIATSAGAIIGTVGYMSPEQLVGDSSLVDTRADIYSIGVLIFELLSGHQPFDLSEMPLTQAVVTVSESEAPKMGTLDRALRGDIETIVAKSLAHDPDRRYQSAGSFADDIRRHLADQPIQARSPTLGYQASKFAKRNKGLVAGVSVATIAVFGGLFFATLSAQSAIKREAEKQVALEEATEIIEFLTNMLGSASPIAAGRDVLVVDILADGVDGLAELEDRPAAQAAVEFAIGVSYRELGDPIQSVALLDKSYHTREQLFGPDDPRTVDAYSEYSLSVHDDEAETAERKLEILLQAVENCERVYGEMHIKALVAKGAVGVAYQDIGQSEKAIQTLKEASDDLRETVGPRDPITLRWSSIYGIVLGRTDARLAEAVLTPIAELQVEILGSDHPHTLDTLMILASSMEDTEASIPILKQAVEGQKKLRGPNSMYALRAMNMLSVALRNAGHLADANQSLNELLVVVSEVLGPTDPRTLRVRYNLTDVQRLLGQIDQAEATARESVRLALTNPDIRAAQVASCYDGLAKVLTTKGDHQLAIEAFDSAIELAVDEYGQDHAEVMGLLTGKAENLLELGQKSEAKILLDQVLTYFNAPGRPAEHPTLSKAKELLSRTDIDG